jgi:hypothetical protein
VLADPALIKLAALSLLMVFTISPAHADPILTPIITSLLVSAGAATTVTIGFATINIAAVLAGVVTTAIGIAAAYAFAPKPKTPTAENGSIAVQQPVAPRAWAYGRVRIGGAVVFKEVATSLYVVQACFGHKCHDLVQWYLNDDAVEVDGNGYVQPVSSGDARYYSPTGGVYVTLEYRKGLPFETVYGLHTAAFPDLWDAEHRGDGVASIAAYFINVVAAQFQARYPYGVPILTAVWDTAEVYDWRDSGQNINDVTTWKISVNPVVCLAHFECFNSFGPQRNFITSILPVLDQWTTEANHCDELVPVREGGSERRYTCNGWMTTEQDNRSARQTILSTCDGWMCERGDGTVIVRAGVFRDTGIVITDDDIVGWQIQTGLGDEDVVNAITATWTCPDTGFSSVETDSIEDTDDQIARGKRRTSRLDLTWAQSNGLASRLLKREFTRGREPVRGRLELRLSAMNALYERWALVSSNSIPKLGNLWIENRQPTINLLQGTCSIQFISSGPHVDDYDAATEESTPPTIPAKPATGPLPVPSNMDVAAEAVIVAAVPVINLEVAWDAPIDSATSAYRTDLGYNIHYRIHDVGGGVPGSWVNTVA